MSKDFTIAGTSTLNGVNTYRFATGKVSVRAGKLRRSGHTDIELNELPSPMSKEAAIEWLTSQGITAVLPSNRKPAVELTDEQKAAAEQAKIDAEAKREAEKAERETAKAAEKAEKAAKRAAEKAERAAALAANRAAKAAEKAAEKAAKTATAEPVAATSDSSADAAAEFLATVDETAPAQA